MYYSTATIILLSLLLPIRRTYNIVFTYTHNVFEIWYWWYCNMMWFQSAGRGFCFRIGEFKFHILNILEREKGRPNIKQFFLKKKDVGTLLRVGRHVEFQGLTFGGKIRKITEVILSLYGYHNGLDKFVTTQCRAWSG